jgi:hypothetical protein
MLELQSPADADGANMPTARVTTAAATTSLFTLCSPP